MITTTKSRLATSARGGGLTEYALVTGLVAAVSISLVAAFGDRISATFIAAQTTVSETASISGPAREFRTAESQTSPFPEEEEEGEGGSVSGLDPLPEEASTETYDIGAFDYGTVQYPWDTHTTRAWAPYVDIPGLRGDATPFEITTSTGGGNPRAESNVVGGGHAASGDLQWGTNLSVDVPEAGVTNVVTLTVGGTSGTFTVIREPKPEVGTFRLTGNNNMNWAQINFSQEGIPAQPYPFTVTGTGATNPQILGSSSGTTNSWGVNISNTTPPRGQTETITLTIAGQVVEWTVTGP